MKKIIFTLIAFLSFCIQYNAIASEDSTNSWSDSYITLGINLFTGPWMSNEGIGFMVGYEMDLPNSEFLMLSPEIILATSYTGDSALFCGATLNLTFGSRDNQFFLGVGAVYGIPVSTNDREANITMKCKLGYIAKDFKITMFANDVYDPFDYSFFGFSLSILL
jgi:hypothetical protein